MSDERLNSIWFDEYGWDVFRQSYPKLYRHMKISQDIIDDVETYDAEIYFDIEGYPATAEHLMNTQEEKSTMKTKIELSNIVSVCSDDVVTLRCAYDNVKNPKLYTFKCKRSFAETLFLHDLVIGVNTRGKCQIVYVHEIHDRCIFETMTQYYHAWVFQKVYLSEHENLKEQENALVEKLETAERNSMQKKVLEALEIDDETKNLLSSNSFEAIANEITNKDDA